MNDTDKEKNSFNPSDHLANERTFLAWIRTSIAMMGFGFVVVKFTLFIKQLSFALGERTSPLSGKGYSSLIGISLVLAGSVMALLAFFRYRNIEAQLKGKMFFPSYWLSAITTVFIIVASFLLILYLLPSLQL